MIRTVHKLPVFARFCLVGGAGFAVDAGVLALLTHGFDISPFWARVPSFSLAVFATWILHQCVTFSPAPAGGRIKSLAAYLASSVAGTLINLGIYSGLILTTAFFHDRPVLALGIGAVAGLAFNFIAAKRVVFKAR